MKHDIRYKVKLSGIELEELQKYIYLMAGTFGLGSNIRECKGRPITFYSWELDCLEAVCQIVLNDPQKYPDKECEGYKALYNLYEKFKKLQ